MNLNHRMRGASTPKSKEYGTPNQSIWVTECLVGCGESLHTQVCSIWHAQWFIRADWILILTGSVFELLEISLNTQPPRPLIIQRILLVYPSHGAVAAPVRPWFSATQGQSLWHAVVSTLVPRKSMFPWVCVRAGAHVSVLSPATEKDMISVAWESQCLEVPLVIEIPRIDLYTQWNWAGTANNCFAGLLFHAARREWYTAFGVPVVGVRLMPACELAGYFDAHSRCLTCGVRRPDKPPARGLR